MAGTKLTTLIFVIPNILRLSATIKREPTQDMCIIMSFVKTCEAKTASSVIEPSISNTERQENNTPKPIVVVKTMAEIQSITDFE